ncbi:MAG: hypothetical protein Q9205_008045, partial [Flavoplaca limonia]
MSRITFLTAVNSVLLGIFAFCLPTYGITLLSKIKYLSLDPLDLATSARYLVRFILAVLFGLLAVWMVLHWVKPQIALLFQARQTTPSVQGSETGNSIDFYARRPASKTTVRLRKQSTSRLTIRRNKELMRRVALLEPSVSKLREAVDE